ncbi:MAG TPA: RNA polymerase sigma factor [Candidatus Binataceae bacterium]|nr:RNA polymerase sigma factor [Candidatus Binataceae bacterium]
MTARIGYQTLLYDRVSDSDDQAIADSAERLDGNDPLFADLLTRAQRGDEAALEQLIRDYQRRVGRMVVTLIGDDADWQDLCQQIFVKMVHGLPRLKSLKVFEPWLFRIVRNACYDHLRHRRSRRYLVAWEDWHDSVAAEPPSMENESASAALARAIAQLPDDQRELITLMRDRQWSYESLARITGDSLAAIKSRLFRARQRLRHLMAAKESEDE